MFAVRVMSVLPVESSGLNFFLAGGLGKSLVPVPTACGKQATYLGEYS